MTAPPPPLPSKRRRGGQVEGVIFRVVFGMPGPRKATSDFGPWHPDKQLVERWAQFFRERGHDVAVESSGRPSLPTLNAFFG